MEKWGLEKGRKEAEDGGEGYGGIPHDPLTMFGNRLNNWEAL